MQTPVKCVCSVWLGGKRTNHLSMHITFILTCSEKLGREVPLLGEYAEERQSVLQEDVAACSKHGNKNRKQPRTAQQFRAVAMDAHV